MFPPISYENLSTFRSSYEDSSSFIPKRNPASIPNISASRPVSAPALSPNRQITTQELFRRAFNAVIHQRRSINPSEFNQYMETIRSIMGQDAPPEILDENNCYHPKLISYFYSQVRHRAYKRIRRNLQGTDQSRWPRLIRRMPMSEWIMYINEAMDDETTEAETIAHHLDTQTDSKLSQDAINKYKYENTWFRHVNNDILLECFEVVTDSVDKGNSFANKISHMLPKSSNPPQDNSTHKSSAMAANGNPPNGSINPSVISGFQIAGFVVSGLYLFISIITPIYKKYVLKTEENVINRWSMRYFIPSVALLALGIVAATVTVVGPWAAIVFAAYSLFNNIMKVHYYIKDYRQLKRDIEENKRVIDETTQTIQNLTEDINKTTQHYLAAKKSGDTDLASKYLKELDTLQQKHKSAQETLLAAYADKEENEVKRIKKFDVLTGVSNALRLAMVFVTISGVILSLIPGMQPVGFTILFVSLCIGTALLAGHWINKFRLIHQEKKTAREKALSFLPDSVLSTELSNRRLKTAKPAGKKQTLNGNKFVDVPPEYEFQPPSDNADARLSRQSIFNKTNDANKAVLHKVSSHHDLEVQTFNL
jgi:hypothetical protein